MTEENKYYKIMKNWADSCEYKKQHKKLLKTQNSCYNCSADLHAVAMFEAGRKEARMNLLKK